MSAQNTPPLITKTHEAEGGTIFEIMINRPEVHNCVDGRTAALLLDAWTRFRDDEGLTVAILHGAGEKAFCSGADLSALAELAGPGATDAEIEKAIKTGTGPMGGTRIIQTKPVITVSQGHTYAGGLELFCHGHIRIAEPAAQFSVACRRWGVPLADGGTVYLPRLLGLAHALPLIVTGQRIGAQRGYEIGLVWEIAPKGRGLERAFSVARQLCDMPRDALLGDLTSAFLGAHLPLEKAFELEASCAYDTIRGESIRVGVERFLSGRRFWFE